MKYQREAYDSTAADMVRITIDRDLLHAVTLGYETSHDGGGWNPTPVRGTILEIKFTQGFPPWLGHLVRTFDLERLSVAKYCISMTCAVDQGRYYEPMVARLRGH